VTLCALCAHFVTDPGAKPGVCDVMRADEAVIRLAARQHAVVTSAQLAAAGLSPTAIHHRVAQGRLTRLHRGVYLVAALPAQFTAEMAAVLACGDAAVLSHHAAAALWGIRRPCHGPVDVTVIAGQARQRRGIRVHRATNLDHTRHHGIPVTTPARTLLDLAPHLPPTELDRAVEQAQVHGLATPTTLHALVATQAGHQGIGALAATLHAGHRPSLTRSEAEARLLALIRAARLPAPITNTRVRGHEVDLLWAEQRLIVEVDGFAFHSTRQAFERDRLRDAELQAAGYRVMRVTWRQIAATPEAVIARLAAALAVS
jgi:very-short-patch-repair endonuclease